MTVATKSEKPVPCGNCEGTGIIRGRDDFGKLIRKECGRCRGFGILFVRGRKFRTMSRG